MAIQPIKMFEQAAPDQSSAESHERPTPAPGAYSQDLLLDEVFGSGNKRASVSRKPSDHAS